MKKSTLKKLKRIIVISIILIGLIYLIAGPISSAAELPKKGEFYYAGTSKGSYVATENIFKWLFNILAEIIQFIFQLILFIIRMVFVGWAALISEALTGTFTAITGVKYDPSDIDASNINVINVQDNITVEAIVFNKIPIFDVDFFNFDEIETVTYTDADRENEGKAIKTPTGKDLSDMRCSTCRRLESFGPHTFEKDKKLGICVCKVEECTCKACEVRRSLMEAHEEFNPMELIKTNVAEWYYTIRLMALVGMLLALGAIGIKMAISTVASDKAQYSQMLTSWVVGIILLFGIHYYMILMININNILVDSVVNYSSDTARDIAEATVSDFGVSASQSDMEINLYEQARTRAYDPNLLNGLTGTILYCTLVYFSVRFAIVYFKRYFTIMILVLMAPGVALTYAIQKAFSGRSHTLSLWLQEFCVNIIIQSVHALIYAAFLSTALRIAFDSLPGSIFAFIILNFMLKALPIFRKIFKMSSDGGLLDDAMKAGSPERLKAIKDNAVGAALAAKPLAKSFSKLPGTKAVVGLAKSPATLIGAAKTAKQKHDFKKNSDAAVDKAKLDLKDIFAQNTETYGEGTDEELEEQANSSDKKVRERADNQLRARRNAIIQRAFEGASLSSIATDKGTTEEVDKEKVEANMQVEANAIVSSVGMEGASEEQVLAAAKQDFLTRHGVEQDIKPESLLSVARKNYKKNRQMMTDFRNRYDVIYDKDMHAHFKKRKIAKTEYNERTGKYEETSAHKQMRELSSLRFALGASPEEMKALKTFLKDTTIGTLSFFTCMAGMGTVVANPKLGMALLATGSQYVKLFAPNRTIRGVNKKRVKNVYSFYDFSPGATLAMGKIGSVEATIVRKEFEKFVEQHSTETLRDIDTNANLGAISPMMYSAEAQEGGEYVTQYLNRKLSDLSPEEQVELFMKTDFAKTLKASDIEAAKDEAKAEFTELINSKYNGKIEDFFRAVNQAEKPEELPGTLKFADKHFGTMAKGLDAIFEAEAKTAKQAQDAFVIDSLSIASMQTAKELRKRFDDIKEQEINKTNIEETEVEATEEAKDFFGLSITFGEEEIMIDTPQLDETKMVKQAVLSTVGSRSQIEKLLKDSSGLKSAKTKAANEIKERLKEMGFDENSKELQGFYKEINARVEQELNHVMDQARATVTSKKPEGETGKGKTVEPLLSEVPENFNEEQFVKDPNDPSKSESKPKVNITEFEKKQLKESLSSTIKEAIKENESRTFEDAIKDDTVRKKILEQYVKKTRGDNVEVENLSESQKAFAEAQVNQFLTDVVEKSKASTNQATTVPGTTDVASEQGTSQNAVVSDGGSTPIQTKSSPTRIVVQTRRPRTQEEVDERMKKISKGFNDAVQAKPNESENATKSLMDLIREGETENPEIVNNQTQSTIEAMILNAQLQKLNIAQARYESERDLEPVSIKSDRMSAGKKQKAKKAIAFIESDEKAKEEGKPRKSITREERRENEQLYDEARLAYTSDIVGMIQASFGKDDNK